MDYTAAIPKYKTLVTNSQLLRKLVNLVSNIKLAVIVKFFQTFP